LPLALATAALVALPAGAAFAADDDAEADSSVTAVPVYRMYNNVTSEHLYISDVSEYNAAGTGDYADWDKEGVAWSGPSISDVAVHRLYNPGLGLQGKMSHHYTTNETEVADLVKNYGWVEENGSDNPLFYSAQEEDASADGNLSTIAGAKGVYRLYNDALSAHLLTMDSSENDNLQKNQGWSGEGTEFYAFASDATKANTNDSGDTTVADPSDGSKLLSFGVTSIDPTTGDAKAVDGATVAIDKEGNAKVTVPDSVKDTHILVNVLDYGTSDPVAGMQVTVADKEGTKISESVTDEDGLAGAIELDVDDVSVEAATYDGEEQEPAVTIEGLTEGEDFEVVDYDNNINATTETSKATVTIKGIGDYTGEVTKEFDIAALEVELNWTGDEFTYNGKIQTPEVEIANAVGEDDVHVVSSTSDGTAPKDAGSYVAVASLLTGEDAANYKLPAVSLPNPLTHNFTIAPKVIEGVEFGDEALVYNGKEQVPTVSVKTGLDIDEAVSATVVYTQGEEVVASPVNAGTYTAEVIELDNDNYALDPEAEEGEYTHEFEIQKATVTIPSEAVSVVEKEYDGTSDAAVLVDTTKVTGIVEADAGKVLIAGTGKYYDAEGAEVKDAGTGYTVKDIEFAYGSEADEAVADNYTLESDVEEIADAEIDAREVTLTWTGDKFTYNADVQTPEVEVGNAVGEDKLEVEVTYTQGEEEVEEPTDAGSYVATASDLTIDGEDTTNYVLPVESLPSQLTHNFTIEKLSLADATVTLTGEDLIYNGEEQEQTVVLTIGEGEDAIVIPESEYTVTDNTAKDAGSHELTVTAGEDSANYTGTATAEFEIAPKVIEGVEFEDAEELVYDGTEKTPTVSVITGLDIDEAVKATVEYTKDGEVVESPVNAGTYVATVTGLDNKNFTLDAEPEEGEYSHEFEIEKRTATITADALSVKEKHYDGTSDAEVSVDGSKIEGFLASDAEAVEFSGKGVFYDKPDGNEVKDAGSDYTVQNFEITFGPEETFNNYTLVNVAEAEGIKGDILAREVDVEWTGDTFTYNGEAQGPEVVVTIPQEYEGEVVPSDVLEADVTYYKNGIKQDEAVDAGTYTATAGALTIDGVETSNYVVKKDRITDLTSYAFTIEQLSIADAVVTLDDASSKLEYSGSEQTVNVQTVVVGEGDNAIAVDSASYEVSENKGKDADTYTLTVKAKDDSNFKGNATANFTINAKPITGFDFALDSNLEYDGSKKEITATAKDVVASDVVNVTLECVKQGTATVVDPINADKYTATVKGIDNTNYKLPEDTTSITLTKDFEITAKTVASVTFDENSLKQDYDGTPKAVVVKVDTGIEGESANAIVKYTLNDQNESYSAPTIAGIYTVTVTGLDNTNFALDGKQTYTKEFIIKGEPTIKSLENLSLTGDYGKILKYVKLPSPATGETPGELKWVDETIVADDGEHEYEAIFTPSSTETDPVSGKPYADLYQTKKVMVKVTTKK
jgi:hypothetical protein